MASSKSSKQSDHDNNNVKTSLSNGLKPPLRNFVRIIVFPFEFQAELPPKGYSATDNPDWKITVYADWFLKGNFRISVTTFLISFLNYYGINISQLHVMGMCRITHFELCYRALKIAPHPPYLTCFIGFMKKVLGFALANVKMWPLTA
jgi:hypothetical protein